MELGGGWHISGGAISHRKQLVSLRRHAAGVTAFAVSKDGKTQASTAAHKGAIVWNLATGKIVKRGKGH